MTTRPGVLEFQKLAPESRLHGTFGEHSVITRKKHQSIRHYAMICISAIVLCSHNAFCVLMPIAGNVYRRGSYTPIAGAEVHCQADISNFPRVSGSTLSDANGAFFLKLPTGYYTITASKPGYSSNTTIVSSTLSSGGSTGNHLFISPRSYTVSAASSPGNGGLITGMGSYAYGALAQLRATAAAGHVFLNWTEDGVVVSRTASYSFTVCCARTLVANFLAEEDACTVAVCKQPAEGGFVEGGGIFRSGSKVTLKASPSFGYRFTDWKFDGTSVANSPTYLFDATESGEWCGCFAELEDPLQNWQSRNLVPEVSKTLWDVAYGNGVFVAVGGSFEIDLGGGDVFGENYQLVMSSDNGMDWHIPRARSNSNDLFGVSYGAGHFVAVGQAGAILRSADGEQWTECASGTSAWLNALTYGNDRFVAVGTEGTILSSADGVSWSKVDDGKSYQYNGICWGDGIYVAVGTDGIWTSSCGDDWEKQSSSLTGVHVAVAYGNGVYIAACGTRVERSADAVVWHEAAGSLPQDIGGLYFAHGNFIAVGAEGMLCTSPDGNTWTRRESGTSDYLMSTTNSDDLFLATGSSGTIIGAKAIPPEITANAGAEVGACDMDFDGVENVLLDGSGSRSRESEIVSWEWSWEGGSASGECSSSVFPLGTTVVTLKVTDANGDSDTDVTRIVVTVPHRLRVVNGTGGGFYGNGMAVDVTAGTPPDARVFGGWNADPPSYSDRVSEVTLPSTAFTMPDADVTLTASYVLRAPDAVSASDLTSTEAVDISWGAVTDATHYRVFRSEEANPWTAEALGDWQTSRAFHDIQALPEVGYYYWVIAASDATGSEASAFSAADTGGRDVVRFRVVFQTDGTTGAVVSGATGQSVREGNDCTLVSANAPVGYEFVNWIQTNPGGCDTESPVIDPELTVTNVTGDQTWTANFAPKTYVVAFRPGAQGYMVNPVSGKHTIIWQQIVSHGGTAIPPAIIATGTHPFVGWTKRLENITEDLTVTARYACNLPAMEEDAHYLVVDRYDAYVKRTGSSVSFTNYCAGTEVNLTLVVQSWEDALEDGGDGVNENTLSLQRCFENADALWFETTHHMFVRLDTSTGVVSEFATFSGGGNHVNVIVAQRDGGIVIIDPPYALGRDEVLHCDGASLTVTAVPDFGYSFAGWENGFSAPEPTQQLTLSSEENPVLLDARFLPGDQDVDSDGMPDAWELCHFDQSAESGDDPDGDGNSNLREFTDGTDPLDPDSATYVCTILVQGEGSVTLDPVGGKYTKGTEVTVTQIPESGYRFQGMSGDIEAATASVTIAMVGDLNLTTHFVPDSGNMVSSLIVTAGDGDGLHEESSNISIEADAPPTGMKFDRWIATPAVHWGRIADDTAASTTFTMPAADVTLTATYALIVYTVTFDLGAHGTRIGGGELIQTVEHGAAAEAPEIEVAADWLFAGWDVPFDDVTEDLTVTAQYGNVTVFFVRRDAVGAGDGLSWADAFTELQPAIEACAAAGGGQVWVAAGIYKPTSGTNPANDPNPRDVQFSLRSNVAVHGGFPADATDGRADSDELADRDWHTHRVILSGDIGNPDTDTDTDGIPDVPGGDSGDNCWTVLSAFLDGDPEQAEPRSPTGLSGLTVTAGGAGVLSVGEEILQVVDCRFVANGAGLVIDGEPPVVADCLFQDNQIGFSTIGGADIRRCRFYRNQQSGAECIWPFGTMLVTESVFVGHGTAAVFTEDGPVRAVNCVFVDNATSGGGRDGTIRIRNSILGDDDVAADSDIVDVSSCLFADAADLELFPTGNVAGDPGFVRAPSDGGDGWGDDPATVDVDEGDNDDFGDLRLQVGSPCIDAGNNAAIAEGVDIDMVGNFRIANEVVDIGAYEYGSSLPLQVTYHGNGNTGGTVPVDDAAYREGDTVTVLGNTGGLVKDALLFAGWNTADDGGGSDYAPNATFAIGGDSVELYAQWGTAYGLAVVNGTGSGDYPEGTVVPTSADPPPAGAEFANWTVDPAEFAGNLADALSATTTFTMPGADVTLTALYEPIPVDPLWSLAFAVQGAEPATLTLGMHPDATDVWDEELDVLCALAGPGQACLASDDLAVSYSTDYRAVADAGEFLLLVSAGADAPATLSWATPELPEGKYLTAYEVAVDGFEGGRAPVTMRPVGNTAVNMALCTSLDIPAGETRWYRIRYGSDLVFDLAFEPGWNLIALPLEPAVTSVDQVLNDSSGTGETGRDAGSGDEQHATIHCGAVWSWVERRYIQASDLHACVGYWVFVRQPARVLVTGLPVGQEVFHLQCGWNLCGVEIAQPVPDHPAITGMSWHWDSAAQTYRQVHVLLPGWGYWIPALEPVSVPSQSPAGDGGQ